MTGAITPAERQAYDAGVDAANRALDRTGLTAQDLLNQWEVAAERALADGKPGRYQYAKGFVDTVREYLQDRSQ